MNDRLIGLDLYHGRYQHALRNTVCDHLITDPPYSERTHNGQRHGRKDPKYSNTTTNPILSNRGLPYEPWTETDIKEFIDFWHPRTRGWMCIMMSHDLVPIYTELLQQHDRYVFAPIPCVQMYRNVRLAGDGPANWTDYLLVARPRTMRGWGALPGAYVGQSHDIGENALDRSKRPVPGGKPLWLARNIILDYSEPGDLICDPCAGGATFLRAAQAENRQSIGAEETEETYLKAMELISGERLIFKDDETIDMFAA